ncbi:MAG: enoyl-CoA hydratase-related protein [Acidobacteriota bacterium]|nr:enoyl-CoA hydratase-related protein [Acidobacteriota bacterium]
MKLETIDYEKRGHVAYVALNRPDKLNAMNDRLHAELAVAWADFRDDPEMRVAILSGRGKCFSAGADLSGGAPQERFEYTGNYPDITRTQGVYKPIIAALHGHVIGYGMWIAMDADIRIGTPDVSFWLPEPQWGIATIPSGWFPKMMPWAIASELLLQAGRVSAERAHEVGILNQVVPGDELMSAAEEVAERIAGLSPVAVQGMKEMMVRAAGLEDGDIDEITGSVQNRVMNSEDRQAGGRAFAERRPVQWPGR